MARDAIPYREEEKFLDVGCGSGSHLYRVRNWGWETYGVEPSESGVEQARALGLDVRHGELITAHFPGSFFDVIRFNNVLEHLTDPRGTFCEIKRILKPDGMVYVTVPNARSLNFWLFGENWYGLDAPRHVISYSPKTLRFLCDATGFEIIRMRFRSGPFNFVRSVKYYLEETGDHWPLWMQRINWPGNKLIRRALKPIFIVVDSVELGDTMLATLKKAPA